MNLWSLDSVGPAALSSGDTVVNAADKNPKVLMVHEPLPHPEAQRGSAARVEFSDVQRSLVLFIRQAEEQAVFDRLDSGDPMKRANLTSNLIHPSLGADLAHLYRVPHQRKARDRRSALLGSPASQQPRAWGGTICTMGHRLSEPIDWTIQPPTPVPQNRRRSGRRLVVLVGALVVCLASSLVGLSLSQSSGKVAVSVPTVRAVSDPLAPKGWSGYAFGAVEVAVPASWRVAPVEIGPCGTTTTQANNTLMPWVVHAGNFYCPLQTSDGYVKVGVLVACSDYSSARLVRSTTPSKVIDGVRFYAEQLPLGTTRWYRLDGSKTASIAVSGPPDLVSQILGTMRPSPYKC